MYLHEFSPPVVHRDIKPANLMLRSGDDSVVLIDFGSVQAAVMPDEGGSTVAGTFGYMAPEQLTGRATPKSDIYGAAATAVAMLSGGKPDLSPREAPDVSRLNIDSHRRELLEWMLATDPENRPDAAEAVEALGDAGTDPSVRASRPPAGIEPTNGDQVSAGSVDVKLARRVLGSRPRQLPPNFYDEYQCVEEGFLGETPLKRNAVTFSFTLFTFTLLMFITLMINSSTFDIIGSNKHLLIALITTFSLSCVLAFVLRFVDHTKRTWPERVWRNGVFTPGELREDSELEYEFEAFGEPHRGDFVPSSIAEGYIAEGPAWESREITVIYLPDDPSKNLPVTESVLEDAR